MQITLDIYAANLTNLARRPVLALVLARVVVVVVVMGGQQHVQPGVEAVVIRNPPSQVSFNTAVCPRKYPPPLATESTSVRTCRGCPDPCGPRARGGGGRGVASWWRGAGRGDQLN